MEPLKRIEIITVSVELNRLKQVLQGLGVPGYTVLPRAEGWGNRGERAGDDLTGVSGNCYVLVACDEELAMQVAEAVRPILRRLGGICLVSDAVGIRHPRK